SSATSERATSRRRPIFSWSVGALIALPRRRATLPSRLESLVAGNRTGMEKPGEDVDASALPSVIRDYYRLAVPNPRPGWRTVRVAQTGEMILKPGGPPRPFTATEAFPVVRG